MSRIGDLIAELCPNGVEFKSVGEVTARSSNIKWANAGDDEFQYIDLSSVDRVTRRIGETASITAGNAPSRAQQIVHMGDVIFATTRPAQMRWAVIPAEYDGQIASTGYCVLRPDTSVILTNFLAHILGTDTFRQYIEANQVAGNYPSIPDNRVRAYRIPVPPLEVQREIVRVLDQFTQLEAELEAELEARRRQYEHYKKVLLTFPEETQWGCVGDVCRVFGGAPFKSDYFNDLGDGLPVVRIRDINSGFSGTFYSGPFDEKYLVRNGDVLIGMDGDFKTVRWAHGDAVLNQRVSRLQDFDDGNDPSFIFYLVRDAIKRIQDATQASTVKHLSTKQIAGIRIPLLPLDEQTERSVVLDDFDALVNDLSIGLPAELAARRKQYEYYRDKLLTFEEAVA